MTSMRETALFDLTTKFYQHRKAHTMTTRYDAIEFLLNADVYKVSHPHAYPKGTTYLQSNWTARGSRLEDVTETVQFGIQAAIATITGQAERFFAADENEVVSLYAEVVEQIVGQEFDATHIRELHRLGRLPVTFSALPEGSLVPIGVPGMIVEVSEEYRDGHAGDFGWVVLYMETALSNLIWSPATVATLAYRLRALVNGYAEQTGVPAAATAFMLHDFSLRGQFVGAGGASGAAHLLASDGSDCLPALEYIDRYYPNEDRSGFVLGSVPATEHSVQTAYNQPAWDQDGHRVAVDEASYVHAILDAYPTGIVSIVADGLDYWSFLDLFSPEAGNGLYKRVIEREGKVVLRPDSGDPVKIINGDPEAPEGSSAYLGTLRVLANHFGASVNEKGFLDLDPHIGVIYGDGMTYQSITAICEGAISNGFSVGSLVFGVGSLSYVGGEITDGTITAMVTRDLFNYAMKATAAIIQGRPVALQKAPMTDSGTKMSARGRLAVLPDGNGRPTLVQNATEDEQARSLLTPVWSNGEFVRVDTFNTVKQRVAENW